MRSSTGARGSVDRLFLDANVLFSAAYRENNGLLDLWKLPEVKLLSCAYALEEARRNLDTAAQGKRLVALAASLELVEGMAPLKPGSGLPTKDEPILGAAIAGRATHLITGDFRHFGRFFGRKLEGIMKLPPGAYLRRRPHQ